MGLIYLFVYFSSWLCCPLRFQNSPQTCWWEDFLVFGNLSSFRTPAWVGSLSLTLMSLFIFYILSYLLLKDNRLPFWVPGVLCLCSEVVLWNFLSVEMFFQRICGGESDLPVLFLCQLRTAPPSFRISNSSTGIPSPPLALFVVMLPKAHLTLHSRMSDSRWVITP